MSYRLHITRKATAWNNVQDPATISRAEWLQYIASDPELARNDYEIDPQYGQNAADRDYDTYVEGLAAWLGHSGQGLKNEYVWFGHEQDRITVEDPDEETLAKMLVMAQVLHARVQGEDGDYFDHLDHLATASIENDTVPLPWGASDFRNFQTLPSAEAAQPLLAALTRQGLTYRTSVDNGQLAFDPSFANNKLISRFVVKLQLADFERGNQVLVDLNQHALEQANPAHYLFGFTDEELFELLLKPDEWSAFDVALAGQLLRQRGRDISADTLRLLRQHRVAELAQPDQDHRLWVAAGYLTALLGGLFGVMVGYQLHFHRKQLPDGRRVYAYSATDRAHGLRILVLGIVCLVGWLAVRVGFWLS